MLLLSSQWSKFHVNIMTDSGVMTIFVYKGLIRNPEIRNTPVCALPNIWELEGVRDTKCSKMPGLQLLPFLSYQEKTSRGEKLSRKYYLFLFFHSLYTCYTFILIWLQFDYGQIANKHRILRCGAYSDLLILVLVKRNTLKIIY